MAKALRLTAVSNYVLIAIKTKVTGISNRNNDEDNKEKKSYDCRKSDIRMG
jgi:hypothetical protein